MKAGLKTRGKLGQLGLIHIYKYDKSAYESN